ncbi:MAG: VOC family protein [Gemmatimonadota bacterium]|jgi:catechol 2,3-dioxygenase-like lactoylglutathione lyase family enzyme
MESVIARLLQAFEQGHMNRRQLIQSLALAATGAHALRAAAPASAAPTAGAEAPFRTAHLDHISYSVSDYGRSRDFYAGLMGWRVEDDDGEQQATLRIGDVGDIIIRNARQPVSLPPRRPGGTPTTGVIDHIAWSLESFDTDAVREELERRGLDPRRDQGPPDMDYDSYHILDPDGWDLQISKRPIP